MTRKYNWDQFSKTSGKLSVNLFDNDGALSGLIDVVFLANSVHSCQFVGVSARTNLIAREISSAISRGFACLAEDGSQERINHLFESNCDVDVF